VNYLEIVNYLMDELDYDQIQPNQTNDAVSSSTDSKTRQVRNAVNRALRHIWAKLGHLNEDAEAVGTITTVPNQENYSFPANIAVIQQVSVGTDPPLRLLPWHEYERKYRGSANYIFSYTGYPIVGTIYQKQLWFYPKPDNIFTVNVRGRTLLTVLSVDDDVPSLPVDGHHAIMEIALYFLYNYEQNPATAGQAETAKEAFEQLRNLIGAHEGIPPSMVSEDQIEEQDSLRRYYLLFN